MPAVLAEEAGGTWIEITAVSRVVPQAGVDMSKAHDLARIDLKRINHRLGLAADHPLTHPVAVQNEVLHSYDPFVRPDGGSGRQPGEHRNLVGAKLGCGPRHVIAQFLGQLRFYPRGESHHRVLVVVAPDHLHAFGNEKVQCFRRPRAEINSVSKVNNPVATGKAGIPDGGFRKRQIGVQVRQYGNSHGSLYNDGRQRYEIDKHSNTAYTADMIEHLHEHIVEELRANTKTDTVFILASILLNLIALAVNAVVAGDEPDAARYTVFSLFVALIVVVNLIVVLGLRRGKQNRRKLLSGLLKMYEDHNVAGYYDASILESYDTRYTLFTIVVVFTGLVAIAVPLVLLVL